MLQLRTHGLTDCVSYQFEVVWCIFIVEKVEVLYVKLDEHCCTEKWIKPSRND